MTWALGIEWYRNDTEKEFDGKILVKAEGTDACEALKLTIPAAIQSIQDRFQHHPESMTHEMHQAVTHGLWWLHIFVKEDLDKLPKNMFDSTSELETKERSFEEIMAEANAPVPDLATPLAADFFYSRNGNEIPSIPDFWMLQAGLD